VTAVLLDASLPLLAERMRRWSGSSLSGPGTADPAFARFDAELGQELCGWLGRAGAAERRSLSIVLAERLAEWLHLRNQFLVLGDGEIAAIVRLYAGAIDRTWRLGTNDEAALIPILRRHQGAIAEIVHRVAGGAPVDVVCAEYSPRTQLRVLGVEPEELEGPVLDLGAGAHGRLVALLRRLGVDAVGVDRYSRVPHVLPGDWLSAPFAPGSWGTVVSHLGFSLHFLHHHRAGDAVDFARAYMRILQALAPGGRFVYSPSLPFIEDLLGPEWEVHRVAQVIDGVQVSATSVRRRDD